MRRILLTTAVGAGLLAVNLQPAKAYGGGFLFGTVAGLAVGTAVGVAVTHPYYPYPYGYPYAYPYAYYPGPVVYPAPVVAAPYPYAPPPGYAPPGYAPTGYAPPASTGRAAPPPQANCGPGQFFSTYTGTCDRR